MQLLRIFLRFSCCFLVLTLVTVAGQNEPLFEIPVQLIGFPIIIASVRIVNFLKKLAYSLSPDTYVSRVKRAHPLIHDEEILDVDQVEKKLVVELGNNVCIYEKICIKYAERSQRRGWERVLNWNEVFRFEDLSSYLGPPNAPRLEIASTCRRACRRTMHLSKTHFVLWVSSASPAATCGHLTEYKSSFNPMKENYLLSVFMGDIIGSPKLCYLLAKRGRACDSSSFD
ncbi:hypothetical protein ALC60_14583 [Trachymyrmex zeteki]|uniref:Uncharacterized protein n=1 Tax=Mycetomoellerius zeteki TaxID=64791 RepID=A0A151WF89_9HYME|nr:hypothetical protein ALC60_14583 [Trachymyrmex zeteki]